MKDVKREHELEESPGGVRKGGGREMETEDERERERKKERKKEKISKTATVSFAH